MKVIFSMEILPPSNEPVGEGEGTDEHDIIPSLLNDLPFKIRPDEEKLALVQKGRPIPKLYIVKRDSTRNCNRTFQQSWYSIHKWLCGSKQYNKLFCWPCILMRPESSSWCSTGNDDMKRLSSMATKHSNCKSHGKAIAEYDATLIGFGLLPEFVNESKNESKKEQEPMDGSDSEDYFTMYFTDDQKSKKSNATTEVDGTKLKSNSVDGSHNSEEKPLGSKPSITFKAWQEMTRHPFARSLSVEDKKLFKWKRKIARQELKNARLTEQKIKIEIELLKTKINHIRSFDISTKMPPSETPQTIPLIVQVESMDSSNIETALN